MFKRILVITDNLNLAFEFEKIILSSSFSGKIAFGVSPFSSRELFCDRLKSEVKYYDLKNDKVVDKIIEEFELVFSIHCKQIFPDKLVDNLKCVNIHPGYNPINRGWYPQVFAILKDLPIGATIHEIDKKLDHGAIIAREFVPKYGWDTSETIYNRVIAKEIELLEEFLDRILKNKYEIVQPEKEGNLFLKKDFNDLLEFKLEEKASFAEFLKRLKALSFKGYKNAYFIDPDSSKKVYLNLSLEVENE